MTEVALSTFPSLAVVSMDATRQSSVGTVVVGEVVAGASTLVAEAGDFVLTGLSATFGYTRAARHFAVSAFPTPLVVGEVAVDSVAPGVVVLGGEAGGQFSIRADAGQFSLTGIAADLVTTGRFEGDVGAFVLAGQVAALRKGYSLQAGAGTFEYLLASALQVLRAESAAFTMLGQAADLIYAPATTTLVAAGATFNVQGGDAEFLWNVEFAAEAGGFVLTGGDAGFTIGNRALTAETGVFVLDGRPTGNHLRASAGIFTLTASDADMELNADTFWQRVDDTPEVWTKVSV